MTLDYSLASCVADSGETVQIRDQNVTGETADGTIVSSPITITVSCSSPAPLSARKALGEDFQIGDFILWVSSQDPRLTFSPTTEHTALFAGESYQIVESRTIREFGQTIGYELRLRGVD